MEEITLATCSVASCSKVGWIFARTRLFSFNINCKEKEKELLTIQDLSDFQK